MQIFTKDAQKRAPWIKPLLLASALLIISTGCHDLGPVGSGIEGSETEVQIDTLQVGSIGVDSLAHYSGNLSYYSAGQFNDPLFGDITETALIRPILVSSTDTSAIAADANMKLRLIIENHYFYGDTLKPAQFDLVEIADIWRAKAWKLSNPVPLKNPGTPVGSFTVAGEDSIEVSLSPDWVSRYRQFYIDQADSAYLYDFHGLAIVPRGEAKVIPFKRTGTKFMVYNPGKDTLAVALQQSAHSIKRQNVPSPPAGTAASINTLERLLRFKLDLTAKALGSANLAQVDLVFYADKAKLEQSLAQVSPQAARPSLSTARLYLAEPSDNPEAVDLGSSVAFADYDKKEGAFHFIMTSFTNTLLQNGISDEQEFYMVVGTNNGILKSSLLYTNNAPADKTPKLIVTSIKAEGS